MNASNDLDRRLDDLLADGPSTAPDRSIAAALDHARRHPRRRDPLGSLRPDPMGSTSFGTARRALTLVAAAALLTVAALAAATVGGMFDRRSVVVPPVPSASATTPAAPPASARAIALGQPDREPDPRDRPRRPCRRHRRRRVRRDHRSVRHPGDGPVRPAVRGQRGRRRHRRGEPGRRSRLDRPDLGRLPVRHAPPPHDRARRPHDDPRPARLHRRHARRRASPGADVLGSGPRWRGQRHRPAGGRLTRLRRLIRLSPARRFRRLPGGPGTVRGDGRRGFGRLVV